MILLLGATGYIGQAFASELKRRDWEFQSISRSELDYTSFPALRKLLHRTRPRFVINAAGYTGKPNVDACEIQRADALLGNAILPATLAQACEAACISWGHVSTGCIYHGARVLTDGEWRTERELSSPEMEALYTRHPERFRGFSEDDEPNFCFRRGPCSFYSGTKALGEEAVRNSRLGYIWRPRMPFDDCDDGRSYLSKLLRHDRAYQNINSISHRGDFVKACLDLWAARAPFGTYNITNPGAVSTRSVVERIRRVLSPARGFAFWENDAEFYRVAVNAPRANCILDVSKLLAAGIALRPVDEAIEDSLQRLKARQAQSVIHVPETRQASTLSGITPERAAKLSATPSRSRTKSPAASKLNGKARLAGTMCEA